MVKESMIIFRGKRNINTVAKLMAKRNQRKERQCREQRKTISKTTKTLQSLQSKSDDVTLSK